MKLFPIKHFLFFLLLLIFSNNVCAKKIEAVYLIELGAINLGVLKWQIEIKDNKYNSEMLLRDRGLLSGLYRFSGTYISYGKFIKNSFVSQKYDQIWKTKKKKREVEILFDKNSVSNLIIRPQETEKARLNYYDVKNANDPIASFLNFLLSGNEANSTIDGRRLYKMYLEKNERMSEIIVKKILIKDFVNIWADHKRNDLKYIVIEQRVPVKDDFFPKKIKIKNKNLVFKLSRI